MNQKFIQNGVWVFCLLTFSLPALNGIAQRPTEQFLSSTQVGPVRIGGITHYNVQDQTYSLKGCGSNIWFSKDEFLFTYRKMKGDFILQSRARFTGEGVDAHRKLGWMVRNTLDTNSVMACATVHGDGLTALQFRRKLNDNVEEVRSSSIAPDIIQLERRGNLLIMSVAKFGQPFIPSEVSDIPLNEEVYAGLFVCSHNPTVVEEAIYSNVRIIIPSRRDFVPYRDYIGSEIETVDVESGERMRIYCSPKSLQAPNFLQDGKSLLYNSNGLIYKLPLPSGEPSLLNTGKVKQNNNDHVVSFDGKVLGLSSASGDPKFGSLVYTVPITGGEPRQITPVGPSYLHGISPDGKWLTFTGSRNDEFDIYKIPINGGKEVRLTTAPGLDDGSEYSPDGKFIYFNSTRSGLMQLWRMKADGSSQEQVTKDEYNNWFPHISPDGKWIVFLSFQKDIKADDHPFYKHVYLRKMPIDGSSAPLIIAYVYGGQATINTPSWSPDGKRVAFVSNTDAIGDPSGN